MASRKNEFYMSVKAILDKTQVRKDAKELQELLNRTDIDFNSDKFEKKVREIVGKMSKESVTSIVDGFNAALTMLGKQRIDLSKMLVMPNDKVWAELGRVAAMEFGAGWQAAMKKSGGTVKIDAGIDNQIKQLKANRKKLVDEYNKVGKLIGNKDRIDNISKRAVKDDKDRKMTLPGDLGKHTQGLLGVFDGAVAKMKSVEKGSNEYKAAVLDAQEALRDLLDLSAVWNEKESTLMAKKNELRSVVLKSPTKSNLEKEAKLRAEIKELEELDKAYGIRKTARKLSNLPTSDDAWMVGDEFAKLGQELDVVTKKLNHIQSQISEVDAQIRNLDGGEKTLKTVEAIEKAYERMLNKKSKTVSSPKRKHIEGALNYEPTSDGAHILKLANEIEGIEFGGKDWEEQYVAIVKFVKEYEKYIAYIEEENKNRVKSQQLQINPRYTNLYNKLHPKYDDATISLTALLDRSNKPFGYADTMSGHDTGKAAEDEERIAQAERQAREASEARARAEAEAAEAAERERKAKEEALKTEEKRSKLLLYRRVEGSFDINRVSSKNGDDLRDIYNTLSGGFGGFGDGTFAASMAGAQSLADASGSGTSLFEFDASDYNLYVNKTVEEAENLRAFLMNLQRVIGNGSPFEDLADDFEAQEIAVLNEDQLYQKAQELFANFSMSREQFYKWIESARDESRKLHEAMSAGEEPEDTHNFATRFMKHLGYQGVLNDIKDDPEYSGDYQGSVIYDINPGKVEEYLNKTQHVFNNVDDFVRYLNSLNTPIVDAVEKKTDALDEPAGVQRTLKDMVEDASKHGVPGQSVAEAAGAIVGEGAMAGVDKQELQNVLSAITYNVKIVHDDADKTANKIAIDEAALEQTLTRVFANIINNPTEQNDSNAQEPWAREDTLGTTIKGVLDNIQTNTAKIGTTEVATVADDGVLAAIKTAVESINDKIVKGTKVIKTVDKAEKAKSDGESKLQPSNPDKEKKDAINNLGKLYERLGKLQAEANKSDSEATAQEIDRIQKLIDAEQKRLKITDEQIKKFKELRDASLYDESLKQADKQRKQAEKDDKAALRAEMKDIRDKSRAAKAVSTWRSGKDVHGLTMNMVDDTNGISIDDVMNHPDVSKLHDELSKLTVVQEKVNHQIETNQQVAEEDVIALQKQTAATQQQISVVKDLQKNYEFFSGDNSASLNQTFTGGNLEEQLKQAIILATNGKAKFHEYNATLGQWTYSVDGANNETKNYTAGLRGLDNQLRTVHTSTKKTESLFESIKRKTKEVFTYFSGSSMVYKLFGELRKGIQYIREIDSALTELKKVTDETEETYDKFLETASKTAAKVGSTIKEVVSSTADFARLGYTLKEAAELAEAAQILMNVSEFTDISRATDTLISAVQAFGYTAETSMEVVDLLNMIGNNYAISTADLAQSLTKSSASLVAAGGNLAEAAALTATANKIIQDADSVGTALKTTSLRLRGTSVDILNEEGLDSEGAVTSKSKLQSKVKALSGVDILTETGEYKSTYEILSQIADVWEDINDMDQAALLELISGKRNSSVIAAILQNPQELKEAFEDAQNAEGSALKENEKYLDSIQGRIDLLTNATQTLWNNALDSDVVKFFVDLATQVIKFVDKIGLLGTTLAGVFVYLTAFKKQNPFEWLQHGVQYLSQFTGKGGLKQLVGQLLGVAPAMKMVTAETIANTIATQTNDIAKQKEILSIIGLQNATGVLSIAEKEQAKTAIMAAVANGAMEPTFAANMLAALGYSASLGIVDGQIKIVDATTKSFMASNPIGWILAIVSVLITVVTLLAQIPSEMERLEEKLDNLNSEISSLESEIESLNSELETTQGRMAELLAMDSLSFTEQEELKNLQLQNAELERTIELQKLLLKDKERDRADAAKKWIKSNWDGDQIDKQYAVSYSTTDALGLPRIIRDEWNTQGLDGKEALDLVLPKYVALQKELETVQEVYAQAQKEFAETGKLSYDTFAKIHVLDPDKSATDVGDKSIETAYKYAEEWYGVGYDVLIDSFGKYASSKQSEIGSLGDGIEMVLGDMAKIISDNELSYSMGDEEINKFLDEYFAYQYAYQKAQGIGVTSSAIASIFDDTSSASIKGLKESLSEIASDDSLDDAQKQAKALELVNTALADTSGGYDRLKTSMDIVGISAEEVARYFVQMSKLPDSSTVEGITAQYQKGVDALNKYKGAVTDVIAEFTDLDGKVEQITWGSLFDDEGEAIDTQIAKVLQGADETVRKEFARIVEAVNEGKMSVDDAMKSFSISGVQAGYKLLESAVVELNSDIFKDLGDEISGLIDTFDEFSSALESVANSIELVNKAQAEMAYSGHVSVETALALIESTDDWNKVLEIENGNITLVDGAMDILAQSKLNQIKTNLQLALSEAQAGLEQARLAESSDEVAKTIEESTTEAVRQLAASMGYLSTLIGEFLDGNFFGAHSVAKATRDQILKDTEYEKPETTSSMSVADWEEKVSNIESKLEILEGVDTPSEFEDNYSSDKVSGGNDTEEGAVKSKWDEIISKYENKLALITNERDLIQAEIDKAESQGGQASKEMYDDLIRSQLEEKALLEAKKAELEEYLETHKDSIDPETWTEYNNEINETAVAIKECETNIIDFAKALHDIDMHYFTQAIDEISRLGEEIEFVMSLFEDDDMFDESGNWTDAGITKINLLRDLMTTYAAEAAMWQGRLTDLESMEVGENGLYKFDEDTKNAIEEDFKSMFDSGDISKETYDEYMAQLEEAYAAGGFSKELWTEWHNEAEDGFRDAISAGKDAQDQLIEMNDARIDAIEDGIQKEIEAYEDYIDVLKESLDAERDLFDFKKNVQKQSKDIAQLERRIAALSGSTNAADIAERRKLEAQLLEAKEGLNDTYYERSVDQQSKALDDEASAYSKAKEKYVETLRDAAEDGEAVVNEMILNGIFNADVANEFLKRIQETYNVPLSKELTEPWGAAENEAIAFKNRVGIIAGEEIPPSVTMISDDIIKKLGTDDDNNPWNKALTMADKYADFLTSSEFSINNNDLTTFEGQINSIVSGWESVKQAADDAYTAQTRNVEVGGNQNVGGDQNGGDENKDGGDGSITQPSGSNIKTIDAETRVDMLPLYLDSNENVYYKVQGMSDAYVAASSTVNKSGILYAPKGVQYYTLAEKKLTKKQSTGGGGGGSRLTSTVKYAKGTIGTSRDEWAITDELGDELVLVPGANGNLSFMRKGTSVVPADITANLVEWGQLSPDMLKFGGGANINMINNAVTKREFNLSFDALVKAERIDEGTLPEVKRFVQQEINNLVKQMNNAIKTKGGR